MGIKTLATTLTYRNWLALSPDGRSVAVVDGGDRVVWGPGKHVEVCTLATGKCRPQPLSSPDEVSLDPVFTTMGPLVYDVAPGTASPGFSLVPGVTGAPGAPFSTQDVDSWYGLDDPGNYYGYARWYQDFAWHS